jgi:predicted RNA binding protein YcfA (HicA-like mRNA interferase family)
LFRIQPVNPQKLIEVLQKAGFKVIRRKGSHVIMMDEKKTRIVVPIHPGREVKPGLVRAIIREAGLTRDEFIKLLKE